MRIRELEEKDYEELHEMYDELVERVPYQWGVGFAQFREELTATTSREKEGVFRKEGEVALVAQKAGKLVAVATGAYNEGRGKFTKADTGMIKFALSRPGEEEACRGVIEGVKAAVEKFEPARVRAMPYWYGPPFYNSGCGRLSGAWPWVGHCLLRSGFQVLDQYGTEVRMRKRLREKPEILPTPAGVEIRRKAGESGWCRAGEEFGHWTEMYVDGAFAGECRCLYGENYIKTTGKRLLYLDYLEIKGEFQGRGLGRVLLREALVTAYAAGSTETTLTADATNFAAMSLYRSEGWEPIDLLFEFQQKEPEGLLKIRSW